MAKSLIEELPRIVSEGRREAAQILERLSSGTQIGLQTNELVLPSKDVDYSRAVRLRFPMPLIWLEEMGS